ncbi:MAG: transposase, partial [Anaerolineae bacterium]|nr:transposase [Anaerolineae bacterium]
MPNNGLHLTLLRLRLRKASEPKRYAATPGMQHGSTLVLDESADAKSGSHTAGRGRQHNGRLGKTDMCQVGVFLAEVKATT